MQQGRVRHDRAFRIRKRRKPLELDVDVRKRVLGKIPMFRKDSDDGLAHIAYLSARQKMHRRRAIIFHARNGNQGIHQPVDIGRREDRNDAGQRARLRAVYLGDASMRMIAASERKVERARAGPVARERPLPGQEPAVLDSSHACADDFRPQTRRIMLHHTHKSSEVVTGQDL